MHKQFFSLAMAGIACLLISGSAFAGPPKTYQVTGPILEVTDTMIAVKKGTDRWEIARDANTKVTGDLKVGAKITITYTMTATTAAVAADSGKPAKKSGS